MRLLEVEQSNTTPKQERSIPRCYVLYTERLSARLEFGLVHTCDVTTVNAIANRNAQVMKGTPLPEV